MTTIDDVNGAAADGRDDDKIAADEEIVDGDQERDGVVDGDHHDLYIVLNSIRTNLEQLVDNCCRIHDRMNHIELDCIDLSQPMGDIISLERQLKRLSEIESNFNEMLKNDEDN